MKSINRVIAVLAAGLTLGTSACKDFLDVNNNPNAPDATSANNYLAPMMHWLATSEQFDGRFVGRYTQQWHFVSTGVQLNWDKMGYQSASDNAAQQWRDVY